MKILSILGLALCLPAMTLEPGEEPREAPQEKSAQKEASKEGQPQVSETMTVVFVAEDFRYRSDETRPVLVYEKEFLERFEPLSVGDILKRVAGISGSDDAGEFHLPQLRGIGPEYTQVLINGQRLPGAENDRTLFVDRIPANMVERLEISRSPSADMDAQGVAGTVNIVLKDAHDARDLNLLVGGAYFDRDDEATGQGFLSYGHAAGRLRYSIQGGWVQRYNPKLQTADIFDSEGEQLFKDETNILDSAESSIQTEWSFPLSERASLSGHLMALFTDRKETEDSSFFIDGEFEEGAFDHAVQVQENLGGKVAYDQAHSRGMFHLGLDFQRLELDRRATLGAFEGFERELEGIETDESKDRETKLRAFWTMGTGADHRLKLGLDLSRKERDARRRVFEIDEDEGELEEVDAAGVFRITEQRIDPFLVYNWTIGPRLDFEAGLRVEGTDLDLEDAGINTNDTQWFPSIHYRWRPTSSDIFRLSFARTTKRQDFDELQPFGARDQPRDGQVTVGNPALRPELAIGVDLGYEHYLADQEGIFGLNLFYRKIDDRVETVQIGTDLFQPRNIDEGEVYGLELDAGLPLAKLGMPNLSLFGNLTLQDSRVTDPLTGESRRFHLQSEYVFNLGMIHYLPRLKASYGVNWLKQGKAREVFLAETALIEYGDNLEFLLEKKWKKGFSLRLAGKNLLDGKRTEILEEYETPRGDGEVETTTFESESSGRNLTLTFRGIFGGGKRR